MTKLSAVKLFTKSYGVNFDFLLIGPSHRGPSHRHMCISLPIISIAASALRGAEMYSRQ
jgi:hypothetical protein